MKELIWIDVETTGLYPEKGELLEVACIMTDRNLHEQHFIETVIGHDLYDLTPADGISDYVRKMHTDNGLFEAVSQAYRNDYNLGVAEDALINWILKTDQDNDVHRPRQIASSKPEFDRKWLAFHMPRFARLIHYRTFDMNTLYAFYDTEKEKNEGANHRATNDLRRDIDQCRGMLLREKMHTEVMTRVQDVFQYINQKHNHIAETRDINSLLLGETVPNFTRDLEHKKPLFYVTDEREVKSGV